jgi:hypothetical protein
VGESGGRKQHLQSPKTLWRIQTCLEANTCHLHDKHTALRYRFNEALLNRAVVVTHVATSGWNQKMKRRISIRFETGDLSVCCSIWATYSRFPADSGLAQRRCQPTPLIVVVVSGAGNITRKCVMVRAYSKCKTRTNHALAQWYLFLAELNLLTCSFPICGKGCPHTDSAHAENRYLVASL